MGGSYFSNTVKKEDEVKKMKMEEILDVLEKKEKENDFERPIKEGYRNYRKLKSLPDVLETNENFFWFPVEIRENGKVNVLL
jgi:hypothetical protein